jgi:hypothetical protein
MVESVTEDDSIELPGIAIDLSRGRKIVCLALTNDTFSFSFLSEDGIRRDIALTREAVWGMRLAVETLDHASNTEAFIV